MKTSATVTKTEVIGNKEVQQTIKHDFSSDSKDITITKYVVGNKEQNVYIGFDSEERTISFNNLTLDQTMTAVLMDLIKKL